jgi:hypothetical protein
MKSPAVVRLFAAALLGGLVASRVSAASAPAPVAPTVAGIKAGFAERDITPALGSEQPGGYGKAFHRSFHDACKVRVALFDDGKQKIVLVGLDALVVPRQVVVQARAEIERLTKIPGRNVLIGASHSHSSGPIGMVLPGQFDTAPDDIRKLAYEDSSEASNGYLLLVTRDLLVDHHPKLRDECPVLAFCDRPKSLELVGVCPDRVDLLRALERWSHAK